MTMKTPLPEIHVKRLGRFGWAVGSDLKEKA